MTHLFKHHEINIVSDIHNIVSNIPKLQSHPDIIKLT